MAKREANLLQLSLLGTPKVQRNGNLVSGFITRKAEALFYYLAVTERPHTRMALAALLWPDMPEQNARKNLRDVIASLRKIVGDFLLISHQTLALDLTRPCWVDVKVFSTVLADPKAAALTDLREALGLYHGEFLDGFYTLHAISFEEWARQKREEYHTLVLNGLHVLADRYLATGEYEAGLTATRRLLLLDPWNEEAHRKQMVLLLRTGQRSAALAQYQICVQVLANELRIEPMPETTALYGQIRDGLLADYSAAQPVLVNAQRQASESEGASGNSPPSVSALPHNLPRQLTPFVGRIHESTAVRNKLLDPSYPLVTIVGEGGVGKTRLALSVAQSIVDGAVASPGQETSRYPGWLLSQSTSGFGAGMRQAPFPDGVWFVPLAGLSGSNNLEEQLADAIGNTLDLDLVDNAPRKTQLFTRLASKQLLLILDNFEQLGAGVSFIIELLQRAYNLTFLVTSRHRLNLQAEFVYRLEGLPIPETAESKGLQQEALLDYDSIQLFLERANRTTPGFALTPENQGHVLTICQFVEGLPLGIELAAALVEHHDVAVIAQRLTANYALLAADLADVAPRHRSITNVLDYSWQLLTVAEGQVLAQCSVFQGGFTLAAATAITGATAGQLESLVQQSLLRHADVERFVLHELVRYYADERLKAMPTLQAAITHRYYAYYLDLLSTNQEYLTDDRQIAAAIRLEFDNIRTAWLLAVAADDQTGLAKGLAGLIRCYEMVGRYKEGEALLRETIRHLTELASTARIPSPEAQHLLPKLLLEQGSLCLKLGWLPEAATLYERALAKGHDGADPLLLADSQFRISTLLLARGDYWAALAASQAAQQQALYGNNWALECSSVTNMGSAHHWLGDLEQARTCFVQVLQVARRQGAKEPEALALLHIGKLHQTAGNFAEAFHNYQQALFLLRRIDRQQGMAVVLHQLGALLMTISAFSQALTHFEQALTILQRISERYYEVRVITSLTNLFFHSGNYEKAEAYAEQALRLATESSYGGILAEARFYTGRLWARRGQIDQATQSFQQALTFWQDRGQQNWAFAAQTELAWLAYRQGNQGAARALIDSVVNARATVPLDFSTEPLQVGWRGYQLLVANHDVRAQPLLAVIYQGLQRQAATITDTELRQLFLEKTPLHQAIVQASQTLAPQ